MKNILLTAFLLAGAPVLAQDPPVNVSPKLHPNLQAAQELVGQAYEKVARAQQAHEWDMKGHAQRAKELMEQVLRELKLAAEASTRSRLDYEMQNPR